MPNLRKLLGNDETVWVYLDGRAEWDVFAVMAAEEGFSFGELPADKWTAGHVVAVHSDGRLGHLPLFIWCMSFVGGGAGVRKLDLRKYIEGAGDCNCESAHFRMRMYTGRSSV